MIFNIKDFRKKFKDSFKIKEGIHIEFIADLSLSIHVETKLRWSEVEWSIAINHFCKVFYTTKSIDI